MTLTDHSWKILIDTGGTFTDCIAIDPEKNVQRIKVLSSSALRGKISAHSGGQQLHISQSWGVSNNLFTGYELRLLGEKKFVSTIRDFDPAENTITVTGSLPSFDLSGQEFEITAHEEAPILAARIATRTPLHRPLPPIEMRLGSTRGTNALLERKGARVCFLVTKGFKDLITIGNQQRPDIFALNVIKNKPLYAEVLEIEERMDTQGEVLHPLSESEVERIAWQVAAANPDAIAIALVNSFANNAHEKQLKEALRQRGFAYVSLSSEMANELKILPRAHTAIVNAYLEPIIENYLQSVQSKFSGGKLRIMTSYGGLVAAGFYSPKDSLLSGPAGGVVGAAAIARKLGEEKIITFDMGGTSTDVSRIDGHFDYRFESEIDGIPVFSPVLSIETVAAGGGSICSFDGFKLKVGPESAGAWPGPACYGAGGPLAITDINLLLGRLDTRNFGIPLSRDAAQKAFHELKKHIPGQPEDEDLLKGFLQIANEKMAEAIRKISLSKGHDPKDFALLAFGGAGGQNACALADLLGMEKIIAPYDAGLLSAYGMGQAEIERFAQRQLLRPLEEVQPELPTLFDDLEAEALAQLALEDFDKEDCYVKLRQVFIRFKGQETSLEILLQNADELAGLFREKYEKMYGHWLENEVIEVESVKIVAAGKSRQEGTQEKPFSVHLATTDQRVRTFIADRWEDIPAFDWDALDEGAEITGPALLLSRTSTLFIDAGWKAALHAGKNVLLTTAVQNNMNQSIEEPSTQESHSTFPIFQYSILPCRQAGIPTPANDQREEISQASKKTALTPVNPFAELELFTNRFRAVAEDMGAILQRSSFSVNVKERLDFSCALLDSQGQLVANAPHIPVHLGSLGICVRSVVARYPLEPGDVIITNHPAYGGSHLPDVTLISAVYDDTGALLGYVANRAHHAEIGGKTPGSMPPDAVNLAEEGVVIPPVYLVKKGQADWQGIRELLGKSPWPSRSVEENIADLNGALASIVSGVESLQKLSAQFGAEKVKSFMARLQDYAADCISRAFESRKSSAWQATEYLDDGHGISVSIQKKGKALTFDFTGTSPTHPGNLNATPAVLNSAVIYVLRLMVQENIPLNEGIMKHVEIIVPEGTLLNPRFDDHPEKCPAVVGGNTEVSQRTVDTLIKALGLAACSQGTMNNLIFGNDKFGFYETICGGTGAGEGFHGADAVHQHMTNTKITDPEVLERRYPVRLERMEIRPNSGGDGKWNGGKGVVREITFLEDVTLSLLTQHRKEAPYGLHGGQPGKPGRQYIIKIDGSKAELKGIDGAHLKAGERVVVETPGGGGWGV